MKYIILILIILTSTNPLSAQTDQVGEESNWREVFLKSSEVALPLLMESALKNSEELNILETSIQIAEEERSLNKKSLLSGFSLNANYSYGTMLNLLNTEQTGNRLNAFNLPAQPQYYTGINLNYPLSKLIGYPNELKKHKLLREQSLSNLLIGEKEIRKAVILQYQEILLAKAQLELNQQSLQSNSIHLELAENKFTNGEISISEMSGISEAYAKSAIAFRTAKINYETTILMMEELIGMKIMDLMNTSK